MRISIGLLIYICISKNIFVEKFKLIKKDSSRITVFETFKDVGKPAPTIKAMMISYDYFYKR